jgi:hypothetical protein
LFTINASKVSLKCCHVHVSTSKVGSEMVGSLICVPLVCNRGDWLLCLEALLREELCLDTLLREELCVDRGGLTVGCSNSLNFASTW